MYLVYGVAILILITLFYIISIKPNKKRPLFDLMDPSRIFYAHRGIHNNNNRINPENSLLSFEMAIEMNFGIELDVQVTKDNIPLVFHDKSLFRICGLKGEIKDLTYNDLKKLKLFNTNQHIPTLKEVLELVDGKVPLIVEIKNETANLGELKYIAEILDSYNGFYSIESFNPLVLIWYKKNRPHIMRGQLTSYFRKDNCSFLKKVRNFVLENLMMNFWAKPDFIVLNYKYKNMTSFKICKCLYRPLTISYTIKSQTSLNENKADFDLFIFDSFIPK